MKLIEAGNSIFRDAQYIIQCCKDSVVRAKNTAEEWDRVICRFLLHSLFETYAEISIFHVRAKSDSRRLGGRPL